MKAIAQHLALLTLFAVIVAGCGDKPDQGPTAKKASGHHHEPPHGGTGVELGDHHAHLEFLVDKASGTMTAYVLDAHMENFVRLPAPSIDLSVKAGGAEQSLKLLPVANTATGETVGNTSQFQAQADWLKTTVSFQATVREVTVRGSTFTNVSFEFPSSNAPARH